jgi:hypothetical protein
MPIGVLLQLKLCLGGCKAKKSISEGLAFCGGIRLGSSLPIDAFFRLSLFAAHFETASVTPLVVRTCYI